MDSPISIRIPLDVLQKINADGKRGSVINRILRDHYEEPVVESPKFTDGLTISGPIESFMQPKSGDVVVQSIDVANNTIYLSKPIKHDTKSCRIYRCGMCASLKDK